VVLQDDADTADVAVVSIDGINNGALTGTAQGAVRLVAGDRIVLPDGSGAFVIDDAAILTNRVSIIVPEGMHFVASKRGKKYYPVDSANGQQIVPGNRVYFPDAGSAERAGFIR